MFKRQTVQMLRVKHVWKTNSTNVGKTCLKDKQYKCCECLKDKQYKCCE